MFSDTYVTVQRRCFVAANYNPEMAESHGRPPTLEPSLALDAIGWHDAQGCDALAGHEPRHLVQAEAGHRLAVHLKDLVAHAEQTGVRALADGLAHLLHIHT